MMRFSLVVPMTRLCPDVENTLASALRYCPHNSEVILAHDAEFSDPFGLESEVKPVVVQRANQIRLFNAGVAEASGEFIGFVRPGVELTDNWHQPILGAFSSAQVGSVAPALTSARRKSTLIAGGVDFQFGFRRNLVGTNVRLKSRTARNLSPLGPTSWSAFYRKEALQRIGRVDSQLDAHFMDLEIALCLSTLGYQSVFCADCRTLIDSARKIFREATKPHGLSSQRAIRRHVLHLGTIANRGRSIRAFAGEVISSPLRPWLLIHALQRLKATPFNVRDEEFSDSISVRARRYRCKDTEVAPRHGASSFQHLNEANQRVA